MSESEQYPATWTAARLDQVSDINPPKQPAAWPAETSFVFVPMQAVEEEFGGIDVSKTRPLSEVAKGYMQFMSGDVIIAKITPCMENGKLAIVPTLSSPWAYGSTEFHVVRPRAAVTAKWIAHFLSQQSGRRKARANMAGSAGQLRVPRSWLEQVLVPVPPLAEQARIVAKIEELFSDLDAGVAALERVRAKLKRYRASVLNAAVTGKLTETWRQQHPPTEPADKLLARILDERRKQWEAEQLRKFAEVGKTPPKAWEARYEEPCPPLIADAEGLPGSWRWTSVDQLIKEKTCNGISIKGSDSPPGVAALRLSAMSDRGFDYAKRRYILINDADARSLAIRSGDFFVCRGNGSLHLVGRGTLAQAVDEIVVFPDTMIRARFAKAGVLPQFMARVWQSRLIRQQIEKRAKTSAGIYKVSQREVESVTVPLPPLAEQGEIVAEIERRLSVVEAVEAEVEHGLKRAARLRQAILKRAFEGKLVPQNPADEPASATLAKVDLESGQATRRRGKTAARA